MNDQVLYLWFADNYTELYTLGGRLVTTSYSLLILFLLISLIVFALRSFEGLNMEGKILNLVLCTIFIGMWPFLVFELFKFIREFNRFLVSDVFEHTSVFSTGALANVGQRLQSLFYYMFSVPPTPTTPGSGVVDFLKNAKSDFWNSVVGMGTSGFSFILILLTSAAAAVVNVFYNVYVYLYVLLGPIVIARSIFSEHLESFFELLQELLVVLLWPTTFAVLTGMLGFLGANKNIIGAADADATLSQMISNMGLGLAYLVLIIFVPATTKKFALHIGSSIVSPLLRFAGIAVGLTAVEGAANAVLGGAAKLGGGALGHGLHFAHSAEKYISLGEIVHQHAHIEHGHHTAHKLHHALHEAEHALHHAHEHGHGGHDDHGHGGHDDHGHGDHDDHGHGAHDDHGHGGHDDHGHGDHGHGGGHHAGGHDDHGGGHGGDHHEHQHDHHESHGGGHSSSVFDSSKALPVLLAGDRVQSVVDKLSWKSDSDAQPAKAKRSTWWQRLRGQTPEGWKALEQEKSLAMLTPEGTEKWNDMRMVGIRHDDFDSDKAAILRAYRRAVEKFNTKYGWMYDFEGRFTGRPEDRPGEAQIKDFESLTHLAENARDNTPDTEV